MFLSVLKDRNMIIKQTQQVIIQAAEMSPKAIDDGSKKSKIEAPLSLDAHKRANMLLDSIVVTLGTSLNLPDEEIIRQDD